MFQSVSVGMIALLLAGHPSAQQQGTVTNIPKYMLMPPSGWGDLDTTTSFIPWENVKDWSDRNETKALQVHNNMHDMKILAAALRWKVTSDSTYLTMVEAALADIADDVIDYSDDNVAPSEEPWTIARNLPGYIVAADIIDHAHDKSVSGSFAAKLEEIRTTQFSFDGRTETLEDFAKRRPNNQGVACNLARLCISMFLDDGDDTTAELAEVNDARKVFEKFVGNNGVAGFSFDFGCSAWHNDTVLRGINKNNGSLVNGYNVSGVIPDDQRRVFDSGSCAGPPCDVSNVNETHRNNYPWETLQCLVMTGHFLDRCNFFPFAMQSQAIKRAIDWLYDRNDFPPEDVCEQGTNCPNGADCIDAGGDPDETWVPWITDKYYSTTRAVTEGGRPGKVFGFADWWVTGL